MFGMRRGPSVGPAGVQHRHDGPVRVPGRPRLRRRGRPGRHPRRDAVPEDHRPVRGRGRGARGDQPRAAGRRALADQRPRLRRAPRSAGHERQADRLGPRLRGVRAADRRAVERGRAVRAGADPDPAVRGPLGRGPDRRAAAGLRGHGGRAVPGGGDQGLLHPRAQRPGLPRLGHDRARDRHARRAGRGHQVRGHAARCRQARRADQGPAEDREADRGGVRGDPAAPDARPGHRAGDRVPGRGPGRDHASSRADRRPGLSDGPGRRRDPRVRPGAGRRRRLRLHDLHPVLPRRAPGRGGDRGAEEVVGHAVRPGVRGCLRGRDQARRLAEPRAPVLPPQRPTT